MAEPPIDPERVDPTKLRVAAGTTGQYGFMTVVLTERASQSFKEGLGSIEDTAATGGFDSMRAAMWALKALDPLLGPFRKFFEFCLLAFQSGLGEGVKTLSEFLFSEENVENVKELAKAGKALSIAIKYTVGWLVDARKNWNKFWDDTEVNINGFRDAWNKFWDDLGKSLGITEESLTSWTGQASLLNTQVISLTSATSTLQRKMEDLFEWIKEIVEWIEDHT